MSRFGKVSQMLGQLSESHDMTNATERRGAAATQAQMQVKDAAGFWCIAHECQTVKQAIEQAEDWHHDSGVDTRVILWPSREVVREFTGRESKGAR